MKRGTYTLLIVSSLFIIATVSSGCLQNKKKENAFTQLPKELFQEGDIAFRRGSGLASRMVLVADRQGTYSHTGILKKENNQWYVIHAVPGEPDFKNDPDRVKMEPIEAFFENRKAICGAIMRIQKDTISAYRAAERALELYKANVLFDHQYNLEDSTEMYCTELIDYVYRKEGVDLTEGRMTPLKIPGFSGNYLLPSDIAQSQHLELIYFF